MKPVDMFFPKGTEGFHGANIFIPDAEARGVSHSKHVFSLRNSKPLPFHISRNIPIQPLSGEKKEMFQKPVGESISPVFTTKKIPEIEHEISPELQMEKTKRILDMADNFFKEVRPARSVTPTFFRNIRNMLSMGILFFSSLLIVGSGIGARATYDEVKSLQKNSSEILKIAKESFEKQDFETASLAFFEAEQKIKSLSFFLHLGKSLS